MVKKYIILADTNNDFKIPRQLIEINGEPLIKRTIRLLKENGIKDIIITSHDKRFDKLGAKRYEPKFNDFGKEGGYWLSAFPIELLKEPITFLFGDVYYSENAIKTIVETDTNDLLFFCSHDNTNPLYIKPYDEPLAYKVVNYELFKEKIQEVKDMRDEGLCCREPIVWELYRVINCLNVNEHILTDNYVAINDESCDLDWECEEDILKLRLEKPKLKLSIIIPYYNTYELTIKLLRELSLQRNGNEEVEIIVIDDYCKNEFSKIEVATDDILLKGMITVVNHEKNLGVAKSRNEGIKLARGKYIAFIDSDDQITMDYIDTLLDAIEKYDVDVINFNWYDMTEHKEIRQPRNPAPWKQIYKKQTIQLFREDLLYGREDVAWQEQVESGRYSIVYLDKMLYLYNSNREGSLFWLSTHEGK